MLIIGNSAGGGTNLINSGKNNADKSPDNSNSSIDLYDLVGNESFPVGTIMIFNGNKNDIKSPWFICDGNNGTPNLTGKFVRCVSTPNEANLPDNQCTGGYTDAETPNHTHTVTLSAGGGHKHQFKEHQFTTNTVGNHLHTQYNSPRYGQRSVVAQCGPVSGGSHYINKGATEGNTSKAGSHYHAFNIPRASTSAGGTHNHSSVTVSHAGVSAVGKNVPKHTKMYHIMKVK